MMLISTSVSLALLAAKVFALIDCIRRRADEFEFRSQLPRTTWLVILAFTIFGHVIEMNPLGFLNLLGTLAALVYLAQMRGSDY